MDNEKEIPFGAFDSELMHQEITIPEGFEATIEGNKIILKKTESDDVKIRKELIKVFSNREKYLIDQSFGDITVPEILAWLEKQGEHKKFRDSIQVGDEVTRNSDGVIVNMSQLKRVAKPAQQKFPIEKLPEEMKTIEESLGFTTQKECDEYNQMVSGLIMSDDNKEEQKQNVDNKKLTDVNHEYFSELLENDDSKDINYYAYQVAYCMSHDWLEETATWEDVQKAVKLGAEWQKQKLTWSEEDEEIRKSLIILLQHFCKGYRVPGLEFPVSYKDMLAWLEKQGTSYTKKDVDDAYVEGITFAKNELKKQGENKKEMNNFDVLPGLYKCVHRMFDGTPEGKLLFEEGEIYKCLSKHDRAEFEVSYGHSVYLEDPVVCKHFIPFEKQGEQKPIDKIQLGKKYKCIASPRYSTFRRGNIYKPVDNFLCNLMNLCYECFEPIEDSEQKPTDEDMKEALRTEYEKGRADVFAEMQKEWSEEDESIVLGIEQIVKCASLLNIAPDRLDKVRDWLKFLKDRYTWKPSKEQMQALLSEVEGWVKGCPKQKVLESLYNDLKKLTEE